jgi:phage I-like protein
MNPLILNRDFQHPSDGWYQIEPQGEHPNTDAGVVQVIDAEACQAIANRFAEDSANPNFPGMLVDHEHFRHQVDKESRAFGWLTAIQNRSDGIYGQIRWSTTGKTAVDGGDYRFFSTEYDPKESVILNRESPKGPRRLRPLRLCGLTLTNSPNNKGGKPITNRASDGPEDQFRQALSGAAADSQTTTSSNSMKTVATKLGLAAEASEEAVLDAVTKIMNRTTEADAALAPLQASIKTIEAENATLRETQADADLAPIKNRLTDDQAKNLRAQLITNRAAVLPLLGMIGQPTPTTPTPPENSRILNRQDATSPKDTAKENNKSKADKILNRARELVKGGLQFQTAYAQATEEEYTAQ